MHRSGQTLFEALEFAAVGHYIHDVMMMTLAVSCVSHLCKGLQLFSFSFVGSLLVAWLGLVGSLVLSYSDVYWYVCMYVCAEHLDHLFSNDIITAST